MIIKKILFLYVFVLCTSQIFGAISLAEEFKEIGYVEICDENHSAKTYDYLYASFDKLIEFLKKNPVWEQKLYTVKERFIRSKQKNYYSTDVVGFYDESKNAQRNQVAFYYSIHFHEFVCLHYPEINKVSEIIDFLKQCFDIQKSYTNLFAQVATELKAETVFSSDFGQVPVLLKVVKYLALYAPTRPHYDGTVFSLFLDSTDNDSLLLSAYKSNLSVKDFYAPVRKFSRDDLERTILLIPGTFLTEFFIYPTPHIVVQSGKVRYATIAFAMKPNNVQEKKEFSPLPSFDY